MSLFRYANKTSYDAYLFEVQRDVKQRGGNASVPSRRHGGVECCVRRYGLNFQTLVSARLPSVNLTMPPTLSRNFLLS